MESELNNEIWVFLSHSNKDYEKVVKVRDLLEKNSFRPLMFFLKCLNDDDEIDDLIKREIDSRGRFILCDSENARNSDWVKREVEYIQSKNRIYQTIDIEAPVEIIAERVLEFKKKSTVYISYMRNDSFIYDELSSILHGDWDFAVFDQRKEIIEDEKSTELVFQSIDKALDSGFVIYIVTKNYIESPWCVKELQYVLDRNKDDHIIVLKDKALPFSSITEKIKNFNMAFRTFDITINNQEVSFEENRLYWRFMKEQITEGVRREDPNSMYILAEHFYYDDDRFDLGYMEGMRISAARLAKKAADKGHVSAQYLYNMIIHDYPELERKI